jgi:hypothetical protein
LCQACSCEALPEGCPFISLSSMGEGQDAVEFTPTVIPRSLRSFAFVQGPASRHNLCFARGMVLRPFFRVHRSSFTSHAQQGALCSLKAHLRIPCLQVQPYLEEPVGMALYEWRDGQIGNAAVQGGGCLAYMPCAHAMCPLQLPCIHCNEVAGGGPAWLGLGSSRAAPCGGCFSACVISAWGLLSPSGLSHESPTPAWQHRMINS